MDDRLRRLQRQAQAGDAQAVTRLAGELLRIGKQQTVRQMLHPRVKHHPQDRYFFLEALPEDTAAFCGLCGKLFDLNAEGYPLSDKKREGVLPAKRRVAKKKKHCAECSDQAGRASYHGRPLADRYCNFCGTVVRDNSHRCVGGLPDWISGEECPDDLVENPSQPTTIHWTAWRRY